jgi:CheY-like chemotaxis protein
MDKKRILIVDDEVGAARLLKSNLEETGRYEV